jgi:hypothetical protein
MRKALLALPQIFAYLLGLRVFGVGHLNTATVAYRRVMLFTLRARSVFIMITPVVV